MFVWMIGKERVGVGRALLIFPRAVKTGPECCQTNIEHMVWLNSHVSSRGSDQVDTD